MYILMGRKGTRLDWSRFDALAKERIGYVPERNKRLWPRELEALGFATAAAAARINPNGIAVKDRSFGDGR